MASNGLAGSQSPPPAGLTSTCPFLTLSSVMTPIDPAAVAGAGASHSATSNASASRTGVLLPVELEERPAEGAEILVGPVQDAPLGRRPAPPAVPPLDFTPVHDDLDLLEVAQRAKQVLVEPIVPPGHDEPVSLHAQIIARWPLG